MIKQPRRFHGRYREEQEQENSPTAMHSQIVVHAYDFMKTYLYGLYTEALSNPNIKVIFFNTLQSYSNPVIVSPSIMSINEAGLARIENDIIHARLAYKGGDYFICLMRYKAEMGPDITKNFYEATISGESGKATLAGELYEELYREAIINSIYRGRILRLHYTQSVDNDEPTMLETEIVDDLQETRLDEIFLPEDTHYDLKKFVECVKRNDELKIPLRYMLSGPPGTAKTKIIRAIASECRGKATVILAGGGCLQINMIFNFASFFKPCILCFDDIDLSLGDRDMLHGNNLGSFLQKMDGFLHNNVFVLATTNDKKLVDVAASRPGRFDLVIDVGALNPADYLNLVKKQTQDEEIIRLFTPKILAELKDKKIVGAFLANLIKHITVSKKTNGHKAITEQDLHKMMDKIYRGFYMEPGRAKLGFDQGSEA